MVLMSDVGGSADVADLDVTIDSAGPLPVPDEGPLGPGPYHPSDAEGVNPMPAGGPTSFVGSLQGEVPNGEWRLWVNDDAGADVGSMAGGWCMSLTLSEPVESYCTSVGSTLTIPAVGTAGLATPYPWSLFIAQEGRIARRVRVRIEGLSHTYPDDVDILLVGPQLRRVILMSDAGGSTDMVQQWVSFDDDSQLQLPDDGMIVSDTYFPRNFEEIEVFPGVPWGIEYPELYGFQGLDIHGMWHLYVVDDAGLDVGSATRWCLDVFPLYPVGEATHVRWYDKTALWFDGAPNALGYRVVRGTQSELGNLLTGTPEGCAEPFDDGSNVQVAIVQAVPPPGAFFWYLVLGTSGPNVPGFGPAGEARIAGVETARVVEPAGGLCP
jgi:subtilisin-like proprotein convertase family protein